ncbi:MAG: hypothetical protein QME61_01320 [Patescibacteria group bacterium]|nr:hypothetical protein [Patescibacteria group bacterium]
MPGKYKYLKILSKKFLIKNYIKNKKSILKIAKLTNINRNTISRYLSLNGIEIRTKCKYLSFLNKNFFIKNYFKKKKSINQISKETGIVRSVIRDYTKRLNIKSRSSIEQKRISFLPKKFIITKNCLSFIDGSLLGDGSIPLNPYQREFSYTQGCKYKEYLKYVRKRLLRYGITSSPILTKWINDSRCKEGGYYESYLHTHRYETFKIFRERWYKNGIKRVPKDFQFTPDSLLQFYLSDGNFYREIRLCSSFSIKDAKFLRKLFIKNLKITPRLITSPWMKGKADLAIKKSDIPKFLNYIGKCPIRCYQYKWHDNEPSEKRLERNKRAREVYHLKRQHLIKT